MYMLGEQSSEAMQIDVSTIAYLAIHSSISFQKHEMLGKSNRHKTHANTSKALMMYQAFSIIIAVITSVLLLFVHLFPHFIIQFQVK